MIFFYKARMAGLPPKFFQKTTPVSCHVGTVCSIFYQKQRVNYTDNFRHKLIARPKSIKIEPIHTKLIPGKIMASNTT